MTHGKCSTYHAITRRGSNNTKTTNGHRPIELQQLLIMIISACHRFLYLFMQRFIKLWHIFCHVPCFLLNNLPLCHSNTESEWLSPQHRPLALLDRLLLLALLPKLDEAITSAGQTTVTPPLHTTTHSILGI